MKRKIMNNITEKSLKKIYEKCKPGMLQKFGRVLTYDEFVAHLSYAYEKGLVK